jgi:hypothetical protein
MGAPYLPDFGRCGIPRTPTLTVPVATSPPCPKDPKVSNFRILQKAELQRLTPSDTPTRGPWLPAPASWHPAQSEWRSLESHICQNRADMGHPSFVRGGERVGSEISRIRDIPSTYINGAAFHCPAPPEVALINVWYRHRRPRNWLRRGPSSTEPLRQPCRSM